MTLKKFFFAFFCIILGVFSWIFFKDNQAELPVQECDNIFLSDVYKEYQLQLATFLESESQEELQDNSEWASLTQTLYKPDANLRDFHKELVTFARTSPSKAKHQNFLHSLNHWLITSANLGEVMGNFLFARFPLPKYENNYSHVIQKYHKQISKERPFYISFRTPFYDDGFLYGNLPSYLFSLNNEKNTKVIRMANPAKDLLLVKSFFMNPNDAIQEEFYNYISQLGNEKHLYVNLMKRKGRESKKTQILENFEEGQKSLILISLDKDSDFYWQIRNYSELNDAKAFKKSFHQHLFKKNGNYYWSSKLNNMWQSECKSILNNVHDTYFGSNDILSQKERCDFIELSYIAIVNHLVEKFEPQFLNISCKHSMDRGPSLTTLLYVDQLLKQKKPLDEYHPKIVAMLFSPPLLIHNRCSHTSRIDRFATALARLQAQNS